MSNNSKKKKKEKKTTQNLKMIQMFISFFQKSKSSVNVNNKRQQV